MNIKKHIPKSIKLNLKLLKRFLKDLLSTQIIAKSKSLQLEFKNQITIEQEIKKNEHFENKIANIELGIKGVNGLTIYPNEIFSFWNLISQPNSKNGYKLSRNIVDGKLSEDFGGGLCQLSSIIYHSSIISGLKTIERHNHSVDLYQEEDRFTPLGSDATVVFGYKDLRFQNSLNFPIQIQLKIEKFKLKCTFLAPKSFPKKEIEFTYQQTENGILVETYSISNQKYTLLNKAHYLKLK